MRKFRWNKDPFTHETSWSENIAADYPPSDWTPATLTLEGIKCLGQVWKKIDFFLIWYIKGEWDKDRQRKSKRGTWRAINFPVVSSMAAAPFHTLPIRTFPNQRNTSPSLKWRQLQSLTFLLAPKLCRLQRRYTKNKAMGCTAGGTLVLVGGKKNHMWKSFGSPHGPRKTDREQ